MLVLYNHDRLAMTESAPFAYNTMLAMVNRVNDK
jgi:hypothetical protein